MSGDQPTVVVLLYWYVTPVAATSTDSEKVNPGAAHAATMKELGMNTKGPNYKTIIPDGFAYSGCKHRSTRANGGAIRKKNNDALQYRPTSTR